MNATLANHSSQLKIKNPSSDSSPVLQIKSKVRTQTVTCYYCSEKNILPESSPFEKSLCYNCNTEICIPVESSNFTFQDRIFSTDYFEIFKGIHKKTSLAGDIVTYNKEHLPDKKRGYIASAINKYIGFKVENYLNPKYLVISNSAYSAVRPSKAYSVSHHLQTQGCLQLAEAAYILSEISQTAHTLAKKNIFDHFLPSDILLDPDNHQVFLADYGLRAEIIEIMDEHSKLFIEMLAPETASRRPHNEASAVYSLGILACTMMTGALPFKEVNPRNVSNERERYLKEFELTQLPVRLKDLLDMNVHQRPNFLECQQLFLEMIDQ